MDWFEQNQEFSRDFKSPEQLEMWYLTQQIRGRMTRLTFMLDRAIERLAETGVDVGAVRSGLEEAWRKHQNASGAPSSAWERDLSLPIR